MFKGRFTLIKLWLAHLQFALTAQILIVNINVRKLVFSSRCEPCTHNANNIYTNRKCLHSCDLGANVIFMYLNTLESHIGPKEVLFSQELEIAYYYAEGSP